MNSGKPNKNLAIIGASYLQLPLIRKAKEMGYITHVFAWAANDVGEKEADYFYPISIVEKDKILEKCREINICGICSIASDLAIITVNYVAQNLGLNSNSIECTNKSTNKHLMRKCFEENGDPSPKSELVSDFDKIDPNKYSYPVIVKPLDRSGSRGIYKIERPEELIPACKKSAEEGFIKSVLIEEFANGKEYSVEYISFHGKHHFLAVTLKYTTGAPHFIETGHLEPAPVSESLSKKIQATVEHALTSLGVKEGASHSEIKIDDNENIKIIEIGARMGGDCIGSDLVYYSTGYDFVEMIIDVACGNAPKFIREHEPIPVSVHFILSNEDLKTFESLKNNNPDRILQIVDYHPEKIGSTTDSSNRAGCYIIKE